MKEYSLLKSILKPIKLYVFNRQWRHKNKNNNTYCGNFFPIEKVDIGKMTYGELNIMSFYSNKEHLSIGSYCSIAKNVVFILGGEHNFKSFSTYPFGRLLFNDETLSKGPVVVDDDVWIGANCIILSGTHIGQGAVIGAGSIVSGNIPPYSIYASGKVIKYRFSQEIIDQLIKIDFSRIDIKKIKIETLAPLSNDNIDHIIKSLIGE